MARFTSGPRSGPRLNLNRVNRVTGDMIRQAHLFPTPTVQEVGRRGSLQAIEPRQLNTDGLAVADKFSAVAAVSHLYRDLASDHNDTLNRFIMTTGHSVRTADVYGVQSPSGPGSPARRDSLADPDEISPLLLGTNRAHAIQSSQSGRWHSAARSSFSTFLDKNAGLCLIASSQFFFSVMNICVKWLNSLDEPVPILEVRINSKMVVFLS